MQIQKACILILTRISWGKASSRDFSSQLESIIFSLHCLFNDEDLVAESNDDVSSPFAIKILFLPNPRVYLTNPNPNPSPVPATPRLDFNELQFCPNAILLLVVNTLLPRKVKKILMVSRDQRHSFEKQIYGKMRYDKTFELDSES